MNLSNNNFFDSLPETITCLTNLHHLDLSRNALSGPLPQNIGNLKTLDNLILHDNAFEGSLTESLCKLEKLHPLQIYYNLFEGGLNNLHRCPPYRVGLCNVSHNYFRSDETYRLKTKFAKVISDGQRSLQKSARF